MERRSTKSRWAWVPVVGGLSAIVGVGLLALAMREQSDAVCERGTSWQQRPTNRVEGTLLSTGTEAGIMHGGALIGFPSRDEAAAMGHTTGFVTIDQSEFDAIDRVPRAGLLFAERSTSDRPGRYYYSAGGAVFEVRDRRSLRDVGLTTANAIPIPQFGLDSARRIPPTGTLLRISGRDSSWVIDGGSRRPAESVCDGARIVVVPDSRGILGDIPVLPSRPDA